MSGLFGVGGGFLIVPVLMFVIRMDIAHAVGSSLAIIAMIGVSSGAVYGVPILLAHHSALYFGLGSLLGMLAGRLASEKLAAPMLQRLFAGALLLTGIFMVIQLLRDSNAV